jgi:hypothetical protein
MSETESILSSNPNNAPVRISGWQKAGKRLGAVLYVLLCVEIGIFLLVMPWSVLWSHSLLLSYYPVVRPLFLSSYLRGAISGLGLVNVWLGVSQAWSFRNPATRVSAGD